MEQPQEIEKEDLASKLLPREQYQEKRKVWGQPPYIFEIKKEGQILYYFGANHSHDPDNKQYPKLREVWNKLCQDSNKEKIVMIEGGMWDVYSTEEEAIKKGAEAAFAAFLASRDQIPYMSPEPSRKETFQILKEKVAPEEFFVFQALNFLVHLRDQKESDLENKFERWCELGRTGNEPVELSYKNFKKLYEEILGKPFDIEENFNILIDPNRESTRINQIVRMVSDIRDKEIISTIEKYWNEGKSILVVYGGGHLIIQEPALLSLSHD